MACSLEEPGAESENKTEADIGFQWTGPGDMEHVRAEAAAALHRIIV